MPIPLTTKQCAYCQSELPTGTANKHCGATDCKLQWQREAQAVAVRSLRAQQAAFEGRLKQLKAEFIDSLPTEEEDVAVVKVPHYPNTLEPNTPQKTGPFIAHLRALLESLDEVDKETQFVSPVKTAEHQLDKTLGQMCATCNGRCCRRGQPFHAFIQRSTILKLLNTHHQLSTDEVIQRYTQHIPKHSMSNSCVYHTSTGCQLPRHLQADICGEHYCTDLSGYVDRCLKTGKPDVNIVVSAEDYEVKTIKILTNTSAAAPTDAAGHRRDV